MASSASAASSSKPHPDERFEPDAKWKADLKKRIEENLKGMVQDAKDLLEDGLRKAPTHRDRLQVDFNNSMDNIRKLADDTYREELERERQERRWAMGADLNPAWKESIEKEQQAILDMIKSGKGSAPLETRTADASDAVSEPQQPSPVPDDHTSESPPSLNVSELPNGEQEGADVFGLDTESLTQPPLQRQSIRAGKQKEHDTPRFSSESPPTRSGERYSRPIHDRSSLTALPKPSPERDTSSSGRSFDRSNRSSVELHPPKSSPSPATPYANPPKSDDSPSQSNLQRRTSTSSRSEEQSSHYGLQRRGSTTSQRSIGSTGFRPSSATIPIPETDPSMARKTEQEKRALHEVDQQWSRLESAREKSKDRVGSGSYEHTAYDYSNHSPGPGSVSSSPSQSRRPPTPPMGTKPVYRKPSFMQESTRGIDRRPSIPTLAGGPSLISASRPPDSYGMGMPSQFDNTRQGAPITINPYGISNTMAYATDSPANYYPPYAPPTSYNADSPAREPDRHFNSTPSSPPGHYPIQSTGPMYIPRAPSNGEEDFSARYYHLPHGQSSYRGQGWTGPGPEAQAWRSWTQAQPLGPRYSNSDLRNGQPIRPSAYHNHRDHDPGFDDLDDFEEEDSEQEYGPQSELAHWSMLESRRREEKKRQAVEEEVLKQAEEIKRKQREHARRKELEEQEKKERAEKESLEKEKEKLEQERLEKERLEKERLEKELEMERLEKERLKRERLENERLENQRLEKEKLERERREKEERERLEALEREREKERERLRIEEERKKKEEEARRKAEELRRREEELERKKQEAAQRKREAELRKKEEEIKRKEEEFARIQEEEMKVLREENQKKEEELKRQAQEAKKKEQEAKRREKEARKKELEARKKEEEISQREAELSAREEELKRRESQAEEERRRLKEEEETRMRKEAEMKRAREQEERKRAREAEKRRQKEEEERQQRETEKRRQREEEERQQREEEERRKREEQERWLKEEEERRLKVEEEERQRKEEEERREREEEENRFRAEEELRQRAEAKRLEDERKSEELARKMWEEEQQRAEIDGEWSRREETKKKLEAREAAARAIRERQEAEDLRQKERMEAQWKKMQDERKREEETRKQEDRRREEEARKNQQDSSKSSEFGWANWSSASSAAAWQSQRPSNGTSTPNRSASNSASSAWSASSKSSSASSATSARTSASSTASGASWATSNTSDTSSSSTPTPKARSGSTGASGAPFNEAEWQRRQEEFSRQQQERFIQEQDRLERERLNRAAKVMTKEDVVVMFDNHERLWQRMSTLDQLRWDHFPWPMFKKPASPEEITFTAISAYILSPHYPEKDKSRPEKDRIKEHIRRWHPDRFETKMLPKVIDADKEKVREGAGFVVRSLNDLLTKSNTRLF